MSQTVYKGYIGTYTKGESKGIYSFSLDTDKGEIFDVKVAAEIGNPTYLTINKDNEYLFSVIKKGEKGGAAAFAIQPHTGGLVPLNDLVLDGPQPCHISVDSANTHVVTSNYHQGTAVSHSLKPDGSLDRVLSLLKHEGKGPNEKRQDGPHVHFAGFTPDERYVIVVDLGIDAIVTYRIPDGKWEEVTRLSVNPGSGPRHIVFHPNGKFAYVMTELSSEVIVLDYDSESGSFSTKQYISTLPEDYNGYNDGSAIHITSDGCFVYAANRGHNSIAAFRVDEETGELTYIENISSGGDWPRDFVLDPTERYLVASNQNSGNLVLFSRDPMTGKLEQLQSGVAVPDPVCVKFLHV
ncbi:MAG: lactonase family protein [Tuberibacillus sp.]